MPVGSEERMSVALRMNTGPETEDRRTTDRVTEVSLGRFPGTSWPASSGLSRVPWVEVGRSTLPIEPWEAESIYHPRVPHDTASPPTLLTPHFGEQRLPSRLKARSHFQPSPQKLSVRKACSGTLMD